MITTEQLQLVRPSTRHLADIFATASDPEVTRWVGWPRHASPDDTKAFLAFCDAEWERSPAGPLIIEEAETERYLGTTGLAFEGSKVASTGYVIRQDAWGKGYATEALLGVVDLARQLGVVRLYALCHPEHRASGRVLEKARFEQEGVLRRSTVFPNLEADVLQDANIHARILDPAR